MLILRLDVVVGIERAVSLVPSDRHFNRQTLYEQVQYGHILPESLLKAHAKQEMIRIRYRNHQCDNISEVKENLRNSKLRAGGNAAWGIDAKRSRAFLNGMVVEAPNEHSFPRMIRSGRKPSKEVWCANVAEE